MRKYIYYTPINLARALLDIIPEIKVDSMIDICCGSWNLLRAGNEKYPMAHITGVDVDAASSEHALSNSRFEVMDGRDFAKNEYLRGKTYDLILSNPPFGSLSNEDRKYGQFIGTDEYYAHLLIKRYECEMIQANMLLAHRNSVLVFILPYTFVAGDSCLEARKQIAKDYSVYAIISLPDTTFPGGRIKTFAVIMKKARETNLTSIYLAENNGYWQFNKLREICGDDVIKGNWWFKKNKQTPKIIDIHRGKISSSQFSDKGRMVLHCSSKHDELWSPSIRYYNERKIKTKYISANMGDIVINRIGRAAGYWHVNTKKTIAISDCLFVIKNATNIIVDTLKQRSDHDGRLLVPIRGVTTPYITIDDIKSLFYQD